MQTTQHGTARHSILRSVALSYAGGSHGPLCCVKWSCRAAAYTQSRATRAASRKSASGVPLAGSWQYSHLHITTMQIATHVRTYSPHTSAGSYIKGDFSHTDMHYCCAAVLMQRQHHVCLFGASTGTRSGAQKSSLVVRSGAASQPQGLGQQLIFVLAVPEHTLRWSMTCVLRSRP